MVKRDFPITRLSSLLFSYYTSALSILNKLTKDLQVSSTYTWLGITYDPSSDLSTYLQQEHDSDISFDASDVVSVLHKYV